MCKGISMLRLVRSRQQLLEVGTLSIARVELERVAWFSSRPQRPDARSQSALGRRINILPGSKADKISSDEAYQVLKLDFGKWARKEFKIWMALLGVGLVGVYVFKNRSDAPVLQVKALMFQAQQAKEEGDIKKAWVLSTQAINVATACTSRSVEGRQYTSTVLYKTAFFSAQVCEELGKNKEASRCYELALSSLPHDKMPQEEYLGRQLVILDRLAQVALNEEDVDRATSHYTKAVSLYMQASNSMPLQSDELSLQVSGVLYNYATLKIEQGAMDAAQKMLQTSLEMLKKQQAKRSFEKEALIRSLLDEIDESQHKP